jgi:hypothetical protein
MSTTLPPPSVLTRLEAEVASIMQRIRSGAIWLVSHANTAQKDLSTMEADDPAVAAAVTLATSEIAHVAASNPAVAQAIVTAQDVLREAQTIAGAVPAVPSPVAPSA